MRSFNLRPRGVPPAWAAVCLVALLALPACARSPAHGALRPLGVTPTSARASLPPPPQGELAFETAVRQLVARHPELIALRAEAAEQALLGQPLSETTIEDAATRAAAICDPAEDLRGDRDYKLAMARQMVKRAIRKAAARCP